MPACSTDLRECVVSAKPPAQNEIFNLQEHKKKHTHTQRKRHVNKIFTGLSRDFFFLGGGGDLVYVFSPIRNDNKKNT